MKNKKDKLHIGCGLITPDSWLNLDGSWNAKIAKHSIIKKILKIMHLVPESQLNIDWSSEIFIYNIQKPLPFKDDSFETVYASHLLEHLYLKNTREFLSECFRVIKPGGILRIMVPNLRKLCENYMDDKNILAGDKFIDSLNMVEKSEQKKGLFYKVYGLLTNFHSHKWMYDGKSLSFYFHEAGFSEIKEMNRHNSRIKNIEEVEKRDGLCVEGIKPRHN